MDTISDPSVQRVAVMGGSQWGKTELLINTCFYYIHQEPAPILMVRPSIDDARDFSEDRIKSNAEVTPVIKALLQKSGGRRESGDKLLRKSYPGGHFTLVGSNSATGVSGRPIRIVLLDEIDKYPTNASKKGDPVEQAGNRTKTFWNRKIVLVSTPSIKGASRIEQEWNESDQRIYHVPCPHCGHVQALIFAQFVFDKETGHFDGYACIDCAALIDDRAKAGMLDRGEWMVTRPEGKFPGFHLSALYSPWVTWQEIVTKFLKAKKAPDTLQVFINEDLAELWDPQDGEGIDTDSLTSRRERYLAEVPGDVGVLTASIDVQRTDRLELIVKGWCAGQRSYLIAHHRIYGDPASRDVWDRADLLLTKGYQHEHGAQLHVRATCVDSSDGETVQSVYGFVAPRQRRGIYAIKGSSIHGKPIANRPGKRNKYGVKVIPIGTDTAKDVIFQRLRLKIPEGAGPPDGYMHFPMAQLDGADDEYLAQFGREKVFVRHHRGVPIREYKRVPAGGRNEAIDLEVYALAALHLLGAGVYNELGTWAARAQAEGRTKKSGTPPAAGGAAETVAGAIAAPPDEAQPAAAPAPPNTTPAAPANPPRAQTPQAPRRPPGSGWVNGWRR